MILIKYLPLFAGQNTKRESGRKVQLENINAGKVSEIYTDCDIIRLSLEYFNSFAFKINETTRNFDKFAIEKF